MRSVVVVPVWRYVITVIERFVSPGVNVEPAFVKGHRLNELRWDPAYRALLRQRSIPLMTILRARFPEGIGRQRNDIQLDRRQRSVGRCDRKWHGTEANRLK